MFLRTINMNRSRHLGEVRLALFLIVLSAAFVPLLSQEKLKASGRDHWSDLKLWYAKPASLWTEALPVGNGRLGAMVFGKTDEERIQLNEQTVWTGGPYDPAKPGGAQALPEIRRLVFEGQYLKAHNLFGRTMMGYPVEQQKYQSLGNLWLFFDDKSAVSDYKRELDLDRAIVRVSYVQGGVRFRREVLASPVDRVIVVRLEADRPGRVSFRAAIHGERNPITYDDNNYTVDADGPDGLALRGKTAAFLAIPGRVKYVARLKALVEGGTVRVEDDMIVVQNADAVTLLVAAATNFVSYRDLSGDPETRTLRTLQAAASKPYPEIVRDHEAEHRRLFRRAGLELGPSSSSGEPTDVRLKDYAAGRDPALAALAFQFGRYVLICSSRPGGEPANLQGLWNADMNPWWESKYTTNINLEMNYWPAETANLAECLEPFVRLIEEVAAERGAQAARLHYGAGGWVLHQNTDIWRAASPMDGPTWGTFSVGGAWLCTHLWEHYRFTGDTAFLDRVYPVLKSACEFFLDTLVEHPSTKWLVTCPSTSPENFPERPGNGRYLDEVSGIFLPGTTICAGSTIDMQILRDLFDQTGAAAATLGRDPDFRAKLARTRERLAPTQIGSRGQIQEWLEDWVEMEKDHRHISHLYGLYPGAQISPTRTPGLAEAARKSLTLRGDGGAGWTMAWKAGCWARLRDGEQAVKLLGNLLTKNAFPNLFSRCGQALQVDGTLGAAAAIAEMLLQSQDGELALLPALPREWPSGSFQGLCARDGFVVDLTWANGSPVKAEVLSKLGRDCRVRAGVSFQVRCRGKSAPVARPEKGLAVFKTKPGESYVLTVDGHSHS